MPHTLHHGITLKPADNGGYNLRWNTEKKGLKRSDTYWQDHIEIFTDDDKDKAFGRLKELYEANFSNHKKMMSKSNKKKHNPGNSHPEPAPY